jgi:hypothetical protein
MVKVRSFLIVALVLLCALSVVAQDFMPPPAPRSGGKAKAKKAPSIATAAYTEGQLLNALEMGGDQLLRWQHLDGGWYWPENFSTTDTATFGNQLGVVARALTLIDDKIPAKDYIGDGSYPGARYTGEKLRQYVLSMSPKKYYYAPDRTFLVELTEATGIQDYKTSATQEWIWVKANNPAFATPFDLVDYFMTNRCGESQFNSGYGYGLMNWDLAGYAAACEKIGDHSYANAILNYLVTNVSTYSNPPDGFPESHWNDTANGYNESVLNNMIQRWDDNDATSTTKEAEYIFISAAGHMIWAMNIVDAVTYDSWIQALKTRLLATQDTDGAYKYTKLGDSDVYIQDQGYAMMGIRNVGEQISGRKATEWAILNQETSGIYTGMWREPYDYTGYGYPWYWEYPSFQENNSEMMQGMWDVHEGDVNPWVMITVHPPGSHIDTVPVSFKVFDMQGDPATLWFEYTDDGGSNWYDCTTVLGAVTGVTTSPTGIEHSNTWKSIDDIPVGPGGNVYDCKLRIWARDDSKPGEWGSPAGLTNTFSVLNETIPVELSTFSVD